MILRASSLTLLTLVLLGPSGGCGQPIAEGPPLPFDPFAEVDAPPPPWTQVDFDPLPGASLALRSLRLDCLPGPDPALDNEDPGAEAEERWSVRLETRGWASVTAGVRVFLWDGVPDPQTERHALAYRPPVSMDQVPSGQSDEPYGSDLWALQIPVFLEPAAATAAGGTTLRCADGGRRRLATHDVMVCALDGRDLEGRDCWFCGPHLGAPATAPDTVGRVSGSPGPGGAAPYEVTSSVDCAYGPERDLRRDR